MRNTPAHSHTEDPMTRAYDALKHRGPFLFIPPLACLRIKQELVVGAGTPSGSCSQLQSQNLFFNIVGYENCAHLYAHKENVLGNSYSPVRITGHKVSVFTYWLLTFSDHKYGALNKRLSNTVCIQRGCVCVFVNKKPAWLTRINVTVFPWGMLSSCL